MGVAGPENPDNDTSPDERLLWHSNQDDMDTSISPLVPRRSKKRARSSSPLSSSPAVDKMRTPAVNVKKLKQALKSPRPDPALDLWDRFAVGGQDSKTPLGATNPAFAHLMVSSSPRPQKDASPGHAENGLRRAISCGTHWPKRRRVETVPDTGSGRGQGATTKSSMVTALLESVNDEINKPDEMEANLSPGSPSIKKRRSSREPIVYPHPVDPPNVCDAGSESEINSARDANMDHTKEETSDYDDEGFDDGTLLELDASLLSGQVGADIFQTVENHVTTREVEQPKRNYFEDDDEFDDDVDDDLLAAAEIMAVEAVGTTTDELGGASAMKATTSHDGNKDDLDDAFGDDFGGDFDFEAAELAATQSVGPITSSLMPVRTIR